MSFYEPLRQAICNPYLFASMDAAFAKNIPSLYGRTLCKLLADMDVKEAEAQKAYKETTSRVSKAIMKLSLGTGGLAMAAMCPTTLGYLFEASLACKALGVVSLALPPLVGFTAFTIAIHLSILFTRVHFEASYSEPNNSLKKLEERIEGKIERIKNRLWRMNSYSKFGEDWNQLKCAELFFEVFLKELRELKDLSWHQLRPDLSVDAPIFTNQIIPYPLKA